MISLTCTSCKKQLEIDDAFAGGVCRCQYCGTIQTVPANLKRTARPGAAAAVGAATQKTLWQQKKSAAPAAPPPESAGDAQAASRTIRAARPEPAASSTPDRPKPWMIGVAVGAGAALVIGLIAYFAF